MIKQYEKGKAKSVSTNFNSKEFDCHGKNCCDVTLIDESLVTNLQKIRDHFGAAVVINSGYRCKKHNKSVGGASKSKHLDGMAADITVKGIKPIEVAQFCESIGIKGIGLYGWGCHIDTRTKKGFWESDKQIKVATFIENEGVVSVHEWKNAAEKDGFSFGNSVSDNWDDKCEIVAKKAVCKRRIGIYKYKNLTKTVQMAVGIKGDAVDGKFGKETKCAVQKWQSLKGLEPDGIVGLKTWKRILGVK